MVINIFFGYVDSGTECTLRKLVDDIKLCSAVDMLQGRDAIQRDPHRFERLAHEVQQGQAQGPALGSG